MHSNDILAEASSYKYNSNKSKLLFVESHGIILFPNASHRAAIIVAFKGDINVWCLVLFFYIKIMYI